MGKSFRPHGFIGLAAVLVEICQEILINLKQTAIFG
jgi:hypothetical protein